MALPHYCCCRYILLWWAWLSSSAYVYALISLTLRKQCQPDKPEPLNNKSVGERQRPGAAKWCDMTEMTNNESVVKSLNGMDNSPSFVIILVSGQKEWSVCVMCKTFTHSPAEKMWNRMLDHQCNNLILSLLCARIQRQEKDRFFYCIKIKYVPAQGVSNYVQTFLQVNTLIASQESLSQQAICSTVRVKEGVHPIHVDGRTFL